MRLYCSINLNPNRANVTMSCCECGRELPLYHLPNGWNDALICDGDGIAYQAYYCWRCFQELVESHEPQYFVGQYANQELIDAWMFDTTDANYRSMLSWCRYFRDDLSSQTGERLYVVKHPWTGALTVASEQLVMSKKDWATNPEGFPNAGHVIGDND